MFEAHVLREYLDSVKRAGAEGHVLEERPSRVEPSGVCIATYLPQQHLPDPSHPDHVLGSGDDVLAEHAPDLL
jgi:hypothetical protein